MQSQEMNYMEATPAEAQKKPWSKPEVEVLPVEETSNEIIMGPGDGVLFTS